MIVKIMSRKSIKSIGQLLRYILDKEKSSPSQTGDKPLLTHNLKGTGINQWIKEYYSAFDNRKVVRSDNIALYHSVISFSPKSTKYISHTMALTLAKKYIELRNPNALYMASVHIDKDHVHIHLAESSVEVYSGKSISMKEREFQAFLKEYQAFQLVRYPSLSDSVVRRGQFNKDRITDREYKAKKRDGSTQKEKLTSILKHSFSISASKEEFLQLLKDEGIEPYYRNKKLTGIRYGRKYRFKSLGFEKQLAQLEKQHERLQELQHAKQHGIKRAISRDRDDK